MLWSQGAKPPAKKVKLFFSLRGAAAIRVRASRAEGRQWRKRALGATQSAAGRQWTGTLARHSLNLPFVWKESGGQAFAKTSKTGHSDRGFPNTNAFSSLGTR